MEVSAFHSDGTGGETNGEHNMKMNRRNALLGLGAIATGGGALFGSGAFSSVSADRAVTLNVVGDTNNANLGLAANNTAGQVANDSGGGNGTELGINAQDLNADATTIFNTAIDITNNANSGSRLITHGGVSVGSAIDSIDLYLAGDVGNDLGYTGTWESTEYVTLSNGATITTGLKIKTNAISSSTTENLTLTLEAGTETADISASSELGSGESS